MAEIAGISLTTLLAACMALPADISVMIQGETGIGKSDITRQLGEHFKLPVIDRRVSQMCEGDLLGVPSIVNGVTVFNPPAWFKEACDEPRLLFLDETNRGDPQVLQGVFQIILDRCLGPHKLHPETRVYGAVNVGAIYQVSEMDPAFINRFALFRFTPSVDDWLNNFAKTKLHNLVYEFIKLNPTFLERQAGETYDPGSIYPTRRSWTRSSMAAVQAGIIEDIKDPAWRAIFRSMIGDNAMSKFRDYVEHRMKQVTVEEILNNYSKVASRLEDLGPEKYTLMIDKLQDYVKNKKLTEDQCKNMARYFRSMPDELVVSGWTKLAESNAIDNIKAAHKYIVGYIMLALGRPYRAGQWVGPDSEDCKEYLDQHPRMKMPAVVEETEKAKATELVAPASSKTKAKKSVSVPPSSKSPKSKKKL